MVLVATPVSSTPAEALESCLPAGAPLTREVIQQHIAQQVSALRRPPAPPVHHAQVLSHLLQHVEPVDFRRQVGLEHDSDKLKRSQQMVVIAEEVLACAQRHGWGLCRSSHSLYAYNGAYWQELPADSVKHFLQQAAEKMGLDRYEARFVQFGESLFTQFMYTAYLAPPVRSRELVRINLANGTFQISLDEQVLRPFDAADFLTYQLPFAYDPASLALRFQQFLDRVLPDQECQQVLAEFIGYLFVSPTRLKLEKALLLHGSGANDKSVFFDIITPLLGPENVSHHALQSLTLASHCQQHGRPQPAWLTRYLDPTNQVAKSPDLYGLRQLASVSAGQPVALVEAPKTAVICAGYFPAVTWLAVDSLGHLTRAVVAAQSVSAHALPRCLAHGAGVATKADQLRQQGFTVSVSPLLEDTLSPSQQAASYDLADILLAQWAGYPPAGMSGQWPNAAA